MNEQISWDPSLVKKFSSSNHFKLLNQLRSEVKKYPLNKNKPVITNVSNDNKIDSKNNNIDGSKVKSSSINSYINKQNYSNQSTVSFNNSKNFSIYKNNSNESFFENEATILIEDTNSNNESTSFKDRLNKIDMK